MKIHKNWYLAAAIAGGVGTMGVAAQHEIGWTVLGVICVGCNIYNYLNG